MERVQIQLTGEDLDIRDIQSKLRTSVWQITKDHDGYYLTSKFLNQLSDNHEIESKVKQFLDIINGACNIFHGNHKKVGIGSVIKIDDEGRRHIYVSITESITARSRVYGELRSLGDTNVYPTTVETWLAKAEKHESVRDALHFFNEITWWNLYKVYEIIKDDVGSQNKLYKLIPKSEIKLFTQAAQSRELLGDHARHASRKTYKPPSKSFALTQAIEILKKLFENWIEQKT